MGGGPGAGRGRAEWAARRGGSGRRRGVGSGAGEGEGWCLPRPSPVLKPSRRPRSPAAPPVRAGFWGDSRAFPAVPAEERPRRRLPLCCASTGTRVLRPSSAQAAPHPHSLRGRLRGPAWLDPPRPEDEVGATPVGDPGSQGRAEVAALASGAGQLEARRGARPDRTHLSPPPSTESIPPLRAAKSNSPLTTIATTTSPGTS